jgi:hypothetical protein
MNDDFADWELRDGQAAPGNADLCMVSLDRKSFALVRRERRHDVLFMVIERFRHQNAKAVYHRFREQGRLAPDGLTYVGSWVEANLDRCFQLMECKEVTLLQQWVAQWSDLVAFEIVPVVSSKETAEALSPGAPGPGQNGNQLPGC